MSSHKTNPPPQSPTLPTRNHVLVALRRRAAALRQTVYDDCILIDAYEHRTFMNFETFFNISVWFVCFPPGEPSTCHLFLNRELGRHPVKERRGASAIAMPLKDVVTADPRRDFMAVLLGAISLR